MIKNNNDGTYVIGLNTIVFIYIYKKTKISSQALEKKIKKPITDSFNDFCSKMKKITFFYMHEDHRDFILQ